MADREFSRGISRKFSTIDWAGFGESFKASFRVGFQDDLDDIIEESTQDTNKVDCERVMIKMKRLQEDHRCA